MRFPPQKTNHELARSFEKNGHATASTTGREAHTQACVPAFPPTPLPPPECRNWLTHAWYVRIEISASQLSVILADLLLHATLHVRGLGYWRSGQQFAGGRRCGGGHWRGNRNCRSKCRRHHASRRGGKDADRQLGIGFATAIVVRIRRSDWLTNPRGKQSGQKNGWCLHAAVG